MSCIRITTDCPISLMRKSLCEEKAFVIRNEGREKVKLAFGKPIASKSLSPSQWALRAKLLSNERTATHVFPKELLKRSHHFPAISYASTSGGVCWKPLQATWGMGGILNSSTHKYVHPHNSMFCYSRGCLVQYFHPRPWFKGWLI